MSNNIQWPFGFERLAYAPLDASAVFPDIPALEAYISAGARYPGQILAVSDGAGGYNIFVINDDLTYSSKGEGGGGDSTAAVSAHNESDAPTIHAGIRANIADLAARMDSFETLGQWAGTFDTYAIKPDNISGFSHLTINDFIYIRADENHSDLYARYFVEAIDSSTGDITWGFDRTWADVSLGTADDIKTGDAVTVTVAAGGFKAGDTIADTDSLLDFIKRLLNPRVAAAYTQPNLTLTGTTPLAREIGENITPTLTPTFTQNDGGAIEEYRLLKGGTVIYDGPAAIAHADETFQLIANAVYQAAVDYAQGPVKNDSEGNPDPAGQIQAGTRTSSNVTFIPQRRGFFGPLADSTPPDNTGFIRGLASNVLNPANGTAMVVDVSAGARGVCFAYPATLRPATSIVMASTNFNVVNNFTEAIVSVEGANGFAPIDYRVYFIITDTPFTGTDRYTLTI